MNTVTIVGGGLAGLSLGISLRGMGVPVRVCEAGRYPRHRVCGEFINGVTEKTLGNLGVAELFSDVRRHSTTRWYHVGKPLYATELAHPALGISRHVLDARLAALFVARGGDLQTGRRMARTSVEGQVWAAGRKPDRGSQWIGLKVHVRDLAMTADLEMHLGASGYVGLAPIEEGKVNVCGLFEKQSAEGRGVDLLWGYLRKNGLESLAERLSAVAVDEKSFTGVSAFRLGPQAVEESECVLGDAESMIAPFSGNGMSMAFESAEVASEPLRNYALGRYDWATTRARVREGLRARFRTRLATSRVVHPLLFSDFGKMLLSASAQAGVLPFGPLSRMLR
jgi:flavin-dependent dehydrogenase